MTAQPIDTEALLAELEAAVVNYRSPHPDLAAHALSALTAAEHRATRAEAQSAIRGRAVVMYRERAREAEARIKAVRDIHTGTVWPGVADKPICDACDQMWPCPTTRALEG